MSDSITVRSIDIGPDGRLPGVRVAGFEGRVSADMTPARRAVVLVDDGDHPLRVRAIEPIDASDRLRARIDVASRPYPFSGPLPGIATRIDPVAAWIGDIAVVLGEQEMRLAGTKPRMRALSDGQFAWICHPNDALELWVELEKLRFQDVIAASRSGDEGALRNAAWRLSRAACTDAAMYLAVEALRRSGLEGEDDSVALRKALFGGRNKQEIEEGLIGAARRLDSPPARSSNAILDLRGRIRATQTAVRLHGTKAA